MIKTRSDALIVWVQNSGSGDTVIVTNSAGWVVYAIDSSPTSAGVNAITSTIGTVTLAAANVSRVGLSIYNQSTKPLFMKLGASATTANYTLMMVGSGYYELPRPVYNGIITGLWNSANGFALVSEET